MKHIYEEFLALNFAVLTVSDTRTEATDRSGQFLADKLQAAGHKLAERCIVMDDVYLIRARLSTWIADSNIHTVLITGGTGLSRRDITPEAVMPLLDTRIDGFGELFRSVSQIEIGASTVQSRALAGMANQTLIVCLPGSTGACATAWNNILESQLDCRTQPCNFAQLFLPVTAHTKTPE